MPWARTLLALLASAALLLPAAPAAAHARLVSATPAGGTSSAVAPEEVVLEFNEPVEADFNLVQVRDPGGARVDAGTVETDDALVRVGLEPLTEAGAYEVAYRVLSVDGHPVEGSFTFALGGDAVAVESSPTPAPRPSPTTPAPTSAPSPSPERSPAARASPTEAAATERTGGVLPWVLVAAVAALAVAGTALLRGGRGDG